MYMERFLFSVDSGQLDSKQVQFQVCTAHASASVGYGKECICFRLQFMQFFASSQVYSSDKYARHKLLGETEIRLGDIDLRQPIRIWMHLRDMDEVRHHAPKPASMRLCPPESEHLIYQTCTYSRNVLFTSSKQERHLFLTKSSSLHHNSSLQKPNL